MTTKYCHYEVYIIVFLTEQFHPSSRLNGKIDKVELKKMWNFIKELAKRGFLVLKKMKGIQLLKFKCLYPKLWLAMNDIIPCMTIRSLSFQLLFNLDNPDYTYVVIES